MKNTISIMRRVAAVAGVAAMTLSLAFAQQTTMQPQSMKGAVIKGKAPVNKEILNVNLPKPTEATLANGLQVVVLENHKLPTFAMQMVILSGGLSDPPGKPGLAQFAAALLREGTKTRTSKQISEQIDSLGASLSAGSGLSSSTSNVMAFGLTENLDEVMAIFSDVVLNASFPADELSKLKTRLLAQIRMQRSIPGFLAAEMFLKTMYGQHPAGRMIPSAEEIQSVTPEMLAQFHSTYYRPNNAMFAIVGDVAPAEITAKLEKVFGTWARGDVPQTTIPQAAEPGASMIHLIDRPASVQTNLLVGELTIERTDPDYFALTVMNRIFGGGPSGRLFMNLREDKGYTYGAYSSVTAYQYRGVLQANTEVRTSVTDGALKEIMYEINRLRDEKVPTEEFENAKRAIIGGFALQLESPQTILQNIITQKVYHLPADYWDTYPRNISAVTQDDVQRVARKYLDLGHLQVVAVGDGKQLIEPLKKFGQIEVFDTEGKPKSAAP